MADLNVPVAYFINIAIGHSNTISLHIIAKLKHQNGVMYLSDIKSNSKTVQATSIGHKQSAMLSI